MQVKKRKVKSISTLPQLHAIKKGPDLGAFFIRYGLIDGPTWCPAAPYPRPNPATQGLRAGSPLSISDEAALLGQA